MKQFLIVLNILMFLCLVSYSQNVKEYMFPDGIRKSTFAYPNSDGKADTRRRMVYEYLITPQEGTVFIANFLDQNVISRTKEEYYITDTAIYLININTQNILSYNREGFLGYSNCFLKLPSPGKSKSWSYKESNKTSYSCSALLVTLVINNKQFSAIKVIKMPFENGKYLDRFKTVVYYVKGKGLYKETTPANNKSIYSIYSTEFDVIKKNRDFFSKDSSSKLDLVRLDLKDKSTSVYKIESYSGENGENIEVESPTYFVFERTSVYLIKDKRPIKHWLARKVSSTPDGNEWITNTGETIIAFGTITFTNKKGEEKIFDGTFIDKNKIEIDTNFIK